ncbi:hypothetical protein FI667_g12184, partial [Globisporangium splendens]
MTCKLPLAIGRFASHRAQVDPSMPQSVEPPATQSPSPPPESPACASPRPLPPLASAAFVCRNVCPAIDSVALIVSDFLDFGRPEYWKIPQACGKNDLHLLQRLTSRESPSINRHLKAYLAARALAHSVKHENMEMIRWLHAYCPTVRVLDAMQEAMKLGNLQIMEWLADNFAEIQWSTSYGDTAVQNQDIKVLEWLKERRPECLFTSMRYAAWCGHFGVVKWLHENVQGEVQVVRYAVENGHSEIAKFLHEREYILYPFFDHIDRAAKGGYLDVIQWLHANNLSTCSPYAMDSAAEHGHLAVVQ